MTWTRKKEDGSSISCNFTAPANADEQVNEVCFPLAEQQLPDYAAELTVAITQMETFLQPAVLTGNVDLNVVVNELVSPGAKLYVKLSADASNRTVSLETGFDTDAPDVVVTANTVEFATYVYNGTSFLPLK